LGLEPITLSDSLLEDVTKIARKYVQRRDKGKIPCFSFLWQAQATGFAAVPNATTPVGKEAG